jgi:aminocarboxymuconate-semialdehyde decarboxylase
MVGIAVATSMLGRSVADEDFDPLFAALDQRSAVLFIHPAGDAIGSELVQRLGLGWVIGAPIEATVAVTHLVASGIPTRYPRVRIVVSHLGGATPMLVRRLDNQFPHAVPDAPEPPSVALRRLWFDTVSHGHTPALAAAAMSVGADRLVLGSDFPYVRGERYAEAVSYVEQAGLEPEAEEAILGGTAEGLLRLDGGSG